MLVLKSYDAAEQRDAGLYPEKVFLYAQDPSQEDERDSFLGLLRRGMFVPPLLSLSRIITADTDHSKGT